MPTTKIMRTELTLEPGQYVRIGPALVFNSGRLTNRGLRLGVEAQREVKILRAELERHEEGGEQ